MKTSKHGAETPQLPWQVEGLGVLGSKTSLVAVLAFDHTHIQYIQHWWCHHLPVWHLIRHCCHSEEYHLNSDSSECFWTRSSAPQELVQLWARTIKHEVVNTLGYFIYEKTPQTFPKPPFSVNSQQTVGVKIYWCCFLCTSKCAREMVFRAASSGTNCCHKVAGWQARPIVSGSSHGFFWTSARCPELGKS